MRFTLPETNSSPLKRDQFLKGKARLPSINFQGQTVSFGEGRKCYQNLGTDD